MPDKTVAFTTLIAANGVVNNILTDTVLQYAPGFGRYHIFGRQSASGLQLSANVDGVLQSESLPVNTGTGAPIKPDDHITSMLVARGNVVLIKLDETAGVASTPSIRVEYEEMTTGEIQQAVQQGVGR